MLQSLNRLSLNYNKYNGIINNLYKTTTGNSGYSIVNNNIFKKQQQQQCRYFSSSNSNEKTDKEIREDIGYQTEKYSKKVLDETLDKLRYKDEFEHQIKKEIFKKDNRKSDDFEVRSPIPNIENDEILSSPEVNIDDIVNQQYFDIQPNSNIEDDQGEALADSSRFKPYSPTPSKFRSIPPINGIAYGYAKRKASRALVSLKKGTGEIVINGRTLIDYFPSVTYKDNILQPLVISETIVNWDINIRVFGGGIKGQSEAAARAVGVALCNMDPGYFPALKLTGLLKNDSRKVERKKPGQPKARKQFPLVKR